MSVGQNSVSSKKNSSSTSTSTSSTTTRRARSSAVYDYGDATRAEDQVSPRQYQGVPVLTGRQVTPPPQSSEVERKSPQAGKTSPLRGQASNPSPVYVPPRRVNGPAPTFITPQTYVSTLPPYVPLAPPPYTSGGDSSTTTTAASSVVDIADFAGGDSPPSSPRGSGFSCYDNAYYSLLSVVTTLTSSSADVNTKANMRALITQVRPKAIVIEGAPGSGKDTQCTEIEAKGAGMYVHLSTGNMFRKAVEDDTPLGQEVAPYLKEGRFVPDELVTKIVFDFIKQTDEAKKIALLNGFPRTPEQAYRLHLFAEVLTFVHIDIDSSICKERISRRRTDPETGIVYDDTTVPDPEIEMRLASRRADRNVQLIEQRFQAYDCYIGPIISYFTDVLHVVDGSLKRDRVTTLIQRKLDKPTLEQDTFCSCRLRVATRINIPCGHKVWCYKCAPPTDVTGACECTYPGCGENITRYITVGRYTKGQPEDEADEDKDDGSNSISLNVSLCKRIEGESALVSIQVRARDATKRLPVNVIAVIDVSGSMGNPAQYEEDGEMKNAGCKLLDSVKDSLKAVIGCLTPEDNFGLISFSDDAKILHALQPMTDAIKLKAEKAIAAMCPTLCTNMWAGLEAALKMVSGKAGNNAIMFLTDGEPTDSFPNPISSFETHIKNDPNLQVHTFGFGSGLRPGLLLKLAELGNGTYSFLPDCSTVPAAFVRSMANIGTMCMQNVRLQVRSKNGATFEDDCLRGVALASVISGNKQRQEVNLGALHYGQSKDVVVSVYLPEKHFPENKDVETKLPYLEVYLTSGDGSIITSFMCKTKTITTDAEVAMARTEFVAQTRIAVDNESKGEVAIQTLIARLTQWQDFHPYILLLLEEARGRVAKGCQQGKYTKWGQHYIAALMRAHERQLRINGMDKSLLMYGGTLSDAFEGLGRKIYKDINYKPTAQAAPTGVVSDSSYGGGGGGCFGGQSHIKVLLKNHTVVVKPVSEVRVGELVQTGMGYTRVTHKACIRQHTSVMQLGGLYITPTHPIRAAVFGNVWIQPQKLRLGKNFIVPEVYNFVLEKGISLIVNDIECVVWGHDCPIPALVHPFYGQRDVIVNALAKVSTDETGTHQVKMFLRDANNHAIGFA